MKKIITFKEKDGNWIYDASTPQDLCNASLSVLTRRLEEGCWYVKQSEDEIKVPEIPREQAESMSDEGLGREAKRAWEYYDGRIKSVRTRNKLCDLIEKTVKEKDGLKAYDWLCHTQDSEYEGFEIEVISEPKVKDEKFDVKRLGGWFKNSYKEWFEGRRS